MYISTVCTFVCNLNDLMCVCVFALILEHSCLGCLGDAAYHVLHTSKPIQFEFFELPAPHLSCMLLANYLEVYSQTRSIAIIYLPIYVSLCVCFEVAFAFLFTVSHYASLWQVCLAGIAVIVTLFTVAAPRADPLIGLVAAWALLGIFVELENPENLMNPNKFNFIDWPHFVTEAVRRTALVLSIASACAALIAVGRTTWDWNMGRAEKSLTRDHATAEI